MKTKEFIEKIINIGYEIESDNGYLYIKLPNSNQARECVIGYVGVNKPYILSSDFDWEDEKVLDLMVEYSKTPIDERREEKKYYLRHRWLVSDRDNYLAIDLEEDTLYLDYKGQCDWIKSVFTQKEIDEIKEKYDTNLSDFEIIEVE